MTFVSPLKNQLEDWARRQQPPAAALQAHTSRPGAATGERLASAVEYLPWGVRDDVHEPECYLIAGFGGVEPEYAAIRRGVGILDAPHHGTIRITGADRRDFLNRMLTQELKDLAPGIARESFWLSRKGRVVADLFVMDFHDATLIDVDRTRVAQVIQSLDEYIIMEDIQIENATVSYHQLNLHGPESMTLIGRVCGDESWSLEQGHCTTIHIGSAEVIAARRDDTGAYGIGLYFAVEQAGEVLNALLITGESESSSSKVRPIGWYSYNIARIESGTPIFGIDFGESNLPHETGVLKSRVSFTKGCYLGQEIVARIESLGKPKQMLVGLRIEGETLPVAGAGVYEKIEGDAGAQIGAVTSSTLSPMLGLSPIAFAMLKSSHTEAGTSVLVDCEGGQVMATVGDSKFWNPPVDDSSTT